MLRLKSSLLKSTSVIVKIPFYCKDYCYYYFFHFDFFREASLRWHIKCDHTEDKDSDSDENKEDSSTYVDDNEADPSYKKQRLIKVEGSTERPYSCDLCGCTFKEVLHDWILTYFFLQTGYY